MFGLFGKKDLLEQASADWIFECYLWAFENFDLAMFNQHSQLILPNDHFFPDKADSVPQMAKLISQRVLQYSGLAHWPFSLTPPEYYQPTQPPQLALTELTRSPNNQRELALTNANIASHGQLQLTYQNEKMKKPQDFVASMANLVAQHYLMQSQQTPPGGMQYFNEASEVLTVFMGFGVMIANTAYEFRGSCARCYDPRSNRSASLSENEVIYALAIFGQLKQIETKTITAQLKPHLRSSYKCAVNQLKRNPEQLEMLTSLSQAASTTPKVAVT